jgi:hypothetical protein
MTGWGEERTFELPKQLERFLAILSRRYKKEGREALLRVVVNARPEIDVGAEYDNWNGGQHGHRLRLQVPEALFHEVMESRYDLEKDLCKDLNRLADVPNEFFAEVDPASPGRPMGAGGQFLQSESDHGRSQTHLHLSRGGFGSTRESLPSQQPASWVRLRQPRVSNPREAHSSQREQTREGIAMLGPYDVRSFLGSHVAPFLRGGHAPSVGSGSAPLARQLG